MTAPRLEDDGALKLPFLVVLHAPVKIELIETPPRNDSEDDTVKGKGKGKDSDKGTKDKSHKTKGRDELPFNAPPTMLSN